MQQYRPHYQRCQLLKEFVFFSWDPKSLKSLFKTDILVYSDFKPYWVDNPKVGNFCWLCWRQMQFQLGGSEAGCEGKDVPVHFQPHIPFLCCLLLSPALCTCQNLCECSNTGECCLCKTTSTSKKQLFPAKLRNWPEMHFRVWFLVIIKEHVPAKPWGEMKTSTHTLSNISSCSS